MKYLSSQQEGTEKVLVTFGKEVGYTLWEKQVESGGSGEVDTVKGGGGKKHIHPFQKDGEKEDRGYLRGRGAVEVREAHKADVIGHCKKGVSRPPTAKRIINVPWGIPTAQPNGAGV